MRVALPVAVTVLGLLGAACGGDASTSRATSTPGATSTQGTGSTSSSSRSTTVSVSFGTPLPSTAPPRSTTPTPRTPVATVAAHTAVPAPPPGPCTPAELGISTTTDAARYTTGQTVQVRVVVSNVSAAACVFDAPGDFDIEGDPSGPAVYAVHLACPSDGCKPLSPGQMTTYPIRWNQVANQGPGVGNQVPPGGYHARAVFPGYPPAASAPFSIGP
ncbi:MAG TPA: hypothetical protein VH134_12810 [Candidatus Dormibacteraeota bacterium]|nr:hypothetical protein [Candidatus Dormibacteraeota bacterium]